MYNCQVCDTELSSHIKIKPNVNTLFGNTSYILILAEEHI